MADPNQTNFETPVLWRLPHRQVAGIVFGLAIITLGLSTTRFFLDGPDTVVGRVLLGGAAAFFAAFVLFVANRRNLGGHLVCTAGIATTMAMAIAEGGLHSEALFWTPFVGLLAVFFLGHQFAIVYAVLALASISVVGYLTEFDPIFFAASGSATIFAMMVGVFFETNRVKTEARLSYLASYNPLTRLPSRVMFEFALQQAVSRAKRREESYVVLFMDVDGLKQINDKHGHAAGDALLVEVARRLDYVMRSEERPFHLSGDEFVVIAEQVDQAMLDGLLQRIRTIEEEAFEYKGKAFPVRLSLGSAVGDENSEGLSVLSEADSAMYVDKEARREGYITTPTLDREPPN